ncbi:MAG: aspartate 1-decarboxylase [Coxiellaceae bacterium]|nr:aspartate 1-decarboxylase [Coxiellaceae bacterium]
MLITVMKSKIAYATVTQTELFYVGSITIDKDMIEAAGLRVNEKVQIVNVNNGQRFETYVIEGEAGSKIIGINGPAARLAQPGDELFIISYAMIDPDKETLEPIVVDLKHELN